MLPDKFRLSRLGCPFREDPISVILFEAKFRSVRDTSLEIPSISLMRLLFSHRVLRLYRFEIPCIFCIWLEYKYSFLSDLHFSNPSRVLILHSQIHSFSRDTQAERPCTLSRGKLMISSSLSPGKKLYRIIWKCPEKKFSSLGTDRFIIPFIILSLLSPFRIH